MTGERRLSQAISEGDGISVIVRVASLAEAEAAVQQGADALAVTAEIDGLRDSTTVPLLWHGHSDRAAARRVGADALVVAGDDQPDEDIEAVAFVSTEESLEAALEQSDPQIFLLGLPGAGMDEALDRVLDLLGDVPAGKLAIAELPLRSRDEVEELERAGVDAVLVDAGDVAQLVGDDLPEV